METLLVCNDVPLTADWFHQLKAGRAIDAEEFRKWASSSRKKLKAVFTHPELVDLLIPSMRKASGNTYPLEKLELHLWQTPKGG